MDHLESRFILGSKEKTAVVIYYIFGHIFMVLICQCTLFNESGQ